MKLTIQIEGHILIFLFDELEECGNFVASFARHIDDDDKVTEIKITHYDN